MLFTESEIKAFKDLIFECSKCGNKYTTRELLNLNTIEIFQFEYEYECSNCHTENFSIQYTKIYDT